MSEHRPLHIGLVCEEYPPTPHGGIGSVFRDLAEGLVAAGNRVTVVGVSTTREHRVTEIEERNGVRVVRLPPSSRRLPHRLRWDLERWRLRRAIARLAREQPFDLVEAADYHGWLPRGAGIAAPLVVRIHGSNLFYDTELARPPQVLDHRSERATLRNATHLASVSSYAARRTLEIIGEPQRACEVLPNAVDTGYFSPDADVATEPGLVVFVNMVLPRKGIEQLILAVNEVFPARPHCRLAVVGTDPRGDHLRFVEHLHGMLQPDLRERVVFTGRQPRDEVLRWLRRAEVCCYPSLMETFGVAPIEGMSVGKPVIFSALGPGPEIVDDGRTGLLCDPREPAEIAGCLVRILDDPAYGARLGETARAAVLARFDQRGWIARNLAFYERCLA